MKIQAKYPGTCRSCKGRIAVGSTIEWEAGEGSAHDVCPERPDEPTTNRRPAQPTLDLKSIVDFLMRARVHLQSPKLRMLSVDGRSELKLSLARATARVPNAVYVVISGEFVGSVYPDGSVHGQLVRSPELQAALRAIAENPEAAAKAYAALTGRCMFCGLQLVDDGSVEVGYGPICAKHFGLPWERGGVRDVSTPPAAKPNRFEMIEEAKGTLEEQLVKEMVAMQRFEV